jgi:hypothetical protein
VEGRKKRGGRRGKVGVRIGKKFHLRYFSNRKPHNTPQSAHSSQSGPVWCACAGGATTSWESVNKTNWNLFLEYSRSDFSPPVST